MDARRCLLGKLIKVLSSMISNRRWLGTRLNVTIEFLLLLLLLLYYCYYFYWLLTSATAAATSHTTTATTAAAAAATTVAAVVITVKYNLVHPCGYGLMEEVYCYKKVIMLMHYECDTCMNTMYTTAKKKRPNNWAI